LRAAAIISEELSSPVTRASGQRSMRIYVLLPGPHPRSITLLGELTATREAKSRQGRVRSSANFKYWSGFQVGMIYSMLPAVRQDSSSPNFLNGALLSSACIQSSVQIDQPS